METGTGKRHKISLMILLVFGLSACGALGPRTFNADGSIPSPFPFEYPFDWEVLYRNDSTWALQDFSQIEINQAGEITSFSLDTVGVSIQILTRELLLERFGSTEISSLEMMQHLEQEEKELWQAHQNGKNDELEDSQGLLGHQIFVVGEVYESSANYQICDKEVALMKSNISTTLNFSPFGEKWQAITIVDNQKAVIFGLLDLDNLE